MTVFSDPLAANLVVLGTIFIGLAVYVVYKYYMGGKNEEYDKSFSYFLIGTGFYALAYGLFYSMLWPMPEGGSYSILFGDPYVLLGLASIMGGFAILKNISLTFPGIFAFFSGIMAIVSGYEAYLLNMTRSPVGMLLLYLGAGLSAILILPLIFTKNKWLAVLVALIMVLTAIMAFIIGFPAIGEHLESFAHAP